MSAGLDARLDAIYNMVAPKSVVADIGCDHAHLACALAETGRARKVFACEAALGPFLNAQKTVRDNRLSGKITTVLTDGLNDLPHRGIDTFIIAGMGGELIAEIIFAHSWVKDSGLKFILNPMTKEDKLRRALHDNSFIIENERCIAVDDKVYVVILTSYTDNAVSIDELSFYTGCHLLHRDMASRLYIDKVEKSLAKKLGGLKKAQKPGYMDEILYYEKILREIRAGKQRAGG